MNIEMLTEALESIAGISFTKKRKCLWDVYEFSFETPKGCTITFGVEVERESVVFSLELQLDGYDLTEKKTIESDAICDNIEHFPHMVKAIIGELNLGLSESIKDRI